MFGKWIFGLACSLSAICNSNACTIFVLSDARNTFFFNNEDYSNPVTCIWFMPGGKNYHGAAYVGFDNDWAQGGVNTAGLAFDWVSGYENDRINADGYATGEVWRAERRFKKVRCYTEQRKLFGTFPSVKAAAEYFGVGASYISMVIARKKFIRGYRFRF